MLQPMKQIVEVAHILSLIRSRPLYAVLIRRHIIVAFIRVRAGLKYGGRGNLCSIAAQSKFSQPSRNLWRTGENNVTPPYKEAA